ncbi:sensor histidine kinase FexB [Vibrio cincinnatiensis]|nr:sensor histidine kinase FexB [Vibrio cincinnatiensis]
MNVSAELEAEHANITMEIEDTGIGIPEKELDKIFAMYYQVKSGKDNLHAVGTGIGLAVSRQLINLMDGDISVSSEEGFGSTFTVTIRVPLATPPVCSLPQPEQMRKLNIFMVEDIELNVTVARSLLESLGHSVTVAMTGEEAKVMFKPEQFDLVFLDIQLPDMSGFDIAHYYRQTYSHLPPLVALTANVLKDKKEYIRQGMDEALSKPLSVQAVQEVLAKVLAQQPLVENTSSPVIDPPSLANQELYNRLLDLSMLESYIDIVGPTPMLESIQMLEDMMPGYLEVLDSNMVAKDQAGIVSEAHKIKGSAGSIGLKRIQSVAQKAQSPEAPAWWENITDWVDEIKNEYLNDIQLLKQWLAQRK